MAAVELSEVGDVLRAIAALLWVAFAVAVLLVFRKLVADRGTLSKLGVGPSGVTMEFAAKRLDEAVAKSDADVQEVIGTSAKRSVLERVARSAPRLAEARILWVDDHPESVAPIVELLSSYGATVEVVTSNELAVRRLEGTRYDAVMSDVRRDDEGPNSDLKGVELAQDVFERTGQQTILFTARFDPTSVPGMNDSERLELVRRLRRTVFGDTYRTDEVLHLLLDQLDR